MGTGHEYLAKIHEALRDFESAVVTRESWKPLESKVMREQEVDRARQRVIDAVVAIVTKERMEKA
jgi:Ser/Thr protein kinase RdoA (MazF antagonist)